MSDWVVAKNWSGFVALPVVKQTAKQVVALENAHHRHLTLGDVLAVLPEDRARAMAERLISSAALMSDDTRKAGRRHLDRVEAIKAEFTK